MQINKSSYEYHCGRTFASNIEITEEEWEDQLKKIFRHVPTNINWLAGFKEVFLEKQLASIIDK